MPREQRITVTRGTERRDYRVVYRDDAPERAEAVRFFREHTDSLFPWMELPPAVEAMPLADANAYLQQHPIQERWSALTIGPRRHVEDADLARLRHLPEIRRVQIFSDAITDAGVRHLLHLENLDCLVLSSRRVSDACLATIRRLRSLAALDLQGATNVTREAALVAVAAMPWLQDAWPPPDPVRRAECQRRHRLAQRDVAGEIPPSEAAASLRYVDLARRPLPQPPASLFAADDIGRLDLIDCGLEVLPEAVGNLTRLRTLYASRGRLTDLPAAFGRLAALEELWLNDNQLTGLPDAFARLTALQRLCLDNNRLERFPPVLLALPRLEELRLTDNRLAALPDDLGGLAGLGSLSLGRNRLRTLPRGIGRLTRLTYLGLQGNPLDSLPAEVWHLPCLVTLNLAHTGLTALPPEAANVPNILGLPGRRVHT